MRTTHWEPRKKKLSGPRLVGAMKYVRIDAKTQIEVSVSISDADAIERYHLRHDLAPRTPLHVSPMRADDCIKEIPMGSIEELSEILDLTD